jgi:hypothetical protein
LAVHVKLVDAVEELGGSFKEVLVCGLKWRINWGIGGGCKSLLAPTKMLATVKHFFG